MAKVKLDYINEYKSGDKTFRYYRRAGRRIRIKADPGTVAFAEECAAAEALVLGTAVAPIEGDKVVPGSLKALFIAYRNTEKFKKLADGTKANYIRTIESLYPKYANLKIATMPPEWVQRRQDEYAATPRKANNLIAVLKLIINWGIKRGWRPDRFNPAQGIEPLETGEGHRRWTNAEFAIMTGPEAADIAVAVNMGFYIGQRVSDVLTITWAMYDGREFDFCQQKTGTQMIIDVHPALKRILDKRKRDMRAAGRLVTGPICTRPNGKRWSRSGFTHRFQEIREALELPDDLHFHGLRHTVLSELAENGATDQQMMGFGGHKSAASLRRYIKQASQKKMASAAVAILPNRRSGTKKAKA